MHHVAVVAGLMGGDRGFLFHHSDVNVHRLLQTASYRQSDDAGADNPDSCGCHSVLSMLALIVWQTGHLGALSEDPTLLLSELGGRCADA